MDVYRYKKWFFDDWEYSLERLYIPKHGVIGYFDNSGNIFFYDDEENIKDAEEAISRKSPNEYHGSFELPDEEALQLVALGKTFKNTKNQFEKIAKPLIDKVNF